METQMRCYKLRRYKIRVWALLLTAWSLADVSGRAAELESWKKSTRDEIIRFVNASTKEGSEKYIAPEDRIAVIDNDGTLWREKPLPFEFSFTLDEIRSRAKQHPEWKSQQPFKAVLENDRSYFAKHSESEKIKQALILMAATHSDMSVQAFEKEVRYWFGRAQDEKSRALHAKGVYAPMLEFLAYLRANGFKTYIVTGGDTDFVRAISQQLYGIPPEQVIGSNFQTRWENKNGKVSIQRESKIAEPFNNTSGKPLNIHRIIGKIPVVAVGNSDGDLEMLQYAASSSHPSLEVLIHHDDAKRESAYDKGAEKALAEAKKRHWLVVSMKHDFSRIYERLPD